MKGGIYITEQEELRMEELGNKLEAGTQTPEEYAELMELFMKSEEEELKSMEEFMKTKDGKKLQKDADFWESNPGFFAKLWWYIKKTLGL